MYQIIENIQESPDKWRVRVIVSHSESMFLWFTVEPDQIAVDAAVEDYIRRRALLAPVTETKQLSCSSWQLRKCLNILGLREVVESAIALTDQDTRDGWEYATEFHRNAPLIVQFGEQLDKSDSEMDALFELAKTL